MSFTSD